MQTVLRKLTATFTVTVLVSLCFGLFTYDSTVNEYNQGEALLSWSMIFFIYIGAIILVFGNLVSLSIEWFERRFRPLPWPVFVLLHGLFGLLNGLVFPAIELALAGFLCAMLYALIDRWLLRQKNNGTLVGALFIVPIVLVISSAAILQWTSPPEPSFEAKDAIEKMTHAQETRAGEFPDFAGTETTNEESLVIERTTSVEKIGRETYLVTFTENWRDASVGVESENFLTYKVKRNSTMLVDSGGEEVPH